VALLRAGMRHFWTTQDRPAPRLRVVETLPIAALLLASVAIVVQAQAVLDYARATADALHQPARYIDAVLSQRPLPQPSQAAR